MLSSLSSWSLCVHIYSGLSFVFVFFDAYASQSASWYASCNDAESASALSNLLHDHTSTEIVVGGPSRRARRTVIMTMMTTLLIMAVAIMSGGGLADGCPGRPGLRRVGGGRPSNTTLPAASQKHQTARTRCASCTTL